MAENGSNDKQKSGLYERAVDAITKWVKPGLHRTTEEFIAKSIEKFAENNPRFAGIIKFEVKRRGDGAGLTQDVAEPLLWIGIKTIVAAAVVALSEKLKSGTFKTVSYIALGATLLNNGVELLRLKPRFTAGLQGSRQMALDRIEAIKRDGVDPFDKQQSGSRELDDLNERQSHFTDSVAHNTPVTPTSLMEHAAKTDQPGPAIG